MLLILPFLAIGVGFLAFAAYPSFPRIVKLATAFLVGISSLGLFMLFLAPRDYLQRVPEQLTTVLHPYMIGLFTVPAIFLFFGVSIGAFTSCLCSKSNQR